LLLLLGMLLLDMLRCMLLRGLETGGCRSRSWMLLLLLRLWLLLLLLLLWDHACPGLRGLLVLLAGLRFEPGAARDS